MFEKLKISSATYPTTERNTYNFYTMEVYIFYLTSPSDTNLAEHIISITKGPFRERLNAEQSMLASPLEFFA